VSENVLKAPGRGRDCQLSGVVGKFAKDTRLGCLLKVSGSAGETRGEVVTEGVLGCAGDTWMSKVVSAFGCRRLVRGRHSTWVSVEGVQERW
jgi:hypothetical protein